MPSFRQRLQWQVPMTDGLPEIVNVTPPQQQEPWII